MILVKNNEARNTSIGDLHLGPGVNEVDSVKWDALMAMGYKKSVMGMVEDGLLDIIDGDNVDKITISLVKETYMQDTLERWLDGAKGPLKGAIKKQLKLVSIEMKEA